MAKKTVHLVPHTHWDREWYFNTSRSTIYLIKQVKEVLEILEENSDFSSFVLDAQTSLVEDYLEYHPEDKSRIENLVRNKRLFIGPWYTQTDQLVISQESIVRNLLYGINKAEELGHSFNVGYVPDAFGQGGNMPQIYKSFGIDTAIFWRGVADTTFEDTQFIWEGTDGSKVYSTIMRNGYHFGGEYGIPENNSKKKDYIDDFIGKLDKESNTNHVYFPYGHDQAPVRENLPELISDFNRIDSEREYKLNNPEDYFLEMLESSKNELNIFKGELTQAKHSRVHKTIFSTRADMKQLNNEIENFIVNVLEPILVVADSLGLEYPHTILEKIWKLMFENAAHDSIGGCNSDSTNRDILYRYKVAGDLATNLLEITMRTISNKIKYDNNLNIISFNPLPYNYEGVIEVEAYVPNLEYALYDINSGEEYEYVIEESQELTEYVLKQTIKIDSSKDIYIPEKVYLIKMKVYMKDLKGLGYKSLYIDSNKKNSQLNKYKIDDNQFIENSKYLIELNDDNTIDITDKSSDRIYKNQMVFINSGDDGDSYNFSPPQKDMHVKSINAERTEINVYKNPVNEKLIYSFDMRVPYDLDERANNSASKNLPVTVTIDLEKESETINFNVEIDNNILSHKLSVQFDSGIASKFSFADHLFGPIKRPTRLDEMDIWEEENWDETPISIEPMQSYVALSEESALFSVLTEGVREYEIVGEDFSTIQLTLFRTFSHMGRENLLYRPGRASGETIVETPDAQLLGKIECSFAVYINSCKGLRNVNLAKISKEYLTILPSYQNSDFLNGRMIFSQKREEKALKDNYNLLEFDSKNIGVSAIKKSENNENYLVRLYNPFFDKEVRIPKELKNNETVELDEHTNSKINNKLKHNQFCTIKIDK
ncbi:mannosylglycerate hydrolase [Atopostipes suicloacalis DSM 15692]|uniref:Mannosylglycerate hydrolase n=1 Tax=Atopostipes suicloacalis DSM 15692 TaxID=1121025 RepID=A0A1M4WZU2_9LACT|nr:mannosylglycerate hydrolase [Atopostipes suicloacalis]SHE86583.1 mannosylglycerate hydrolase [Atopostipes suicloacalis DSM 15692]